MKGFGGKSDLTSRSDIVRVSILIQHKSELAYALLANYTDLGDSNQNQEASGKEINQVWQISVVKELGGQNKCGRKGKFLKKNIFSDEIE